MSSSEARTPDGSYTYHLPEGLIAQVPAKQRDHSRLMTVNRSSVPASTLSNLSGGR